MCLNNGTKNRTLLVRTMSDLLRDTSLAPYYGIETGIVIASLAAGNLINWLLHGVLTVQLYLYCIAFPNDKTYTKTIIYTVYFLETAQVIALGIVMLMMIVDGSFVISTEPLPFYSYTGWTSQFSGIWHAQAFLIDLVGGLVPSIAQSLYAYRIWIITQRRVIPWLIITLATVQLVVAILSGFGMSPVIILCWTGLNAVNDLIIAFIMVRSLSKETRLSDHTKSKLVRLVVLIITTGSLTVAANLVCVVLFGFSAASVSSSLKSIIAGWVGVAILIFVPKLYANSILLMLNNRMTIRKSRDAKTNEISTNILSTLVVAFNPIDSTTSHDEGAPVSSLA